MDDRPIVTRRVQQLADLGHRRLGFLGDPASERTERRLVQYWAGIDQAGLREGSVKHGKPLTPEQLRSWITVRGITAVIVEDESGGANLAALEAAAEEIGLRIPADLTVVPIVEGEEG